MADTKKQFVATDAGVHLVAPGQGEHTVCGDAFDLDVDEGPGYAWRVTERQTVTCPACIAFIKTCRGVRTSEAQS